MGPWFKDAHVAARVAKQLSAAQHPPGSLGDRRRRIQAQQRVSLRAPNPYFAGIADDSYFYFVHSYYVQPNESAATLGTTWHGVEMASVLAWNNVLATQFHPEKSATDGLRLYANFAQLCQTRTEPARATALAR